MGQEIAAGRFRKQDFDAFARHLREETALLGDWFDTGRLSSRHGIGGFELEAWLVDSSGQPAPENVRFLEQVGDVPVFPELSQYNIELNTTPLAIKGLALSTMQRDLGHTWQRCEQVAAELGLDVAMVGILPTVRDEMLSIEHMSGMARYRALNEQVMRLRKGRPLTLDIEGPEHLHTEHRDVMLEAATTSFQIHLQVDAARAARYYNTAQLVSGPMVAVSANSPLLFGRRLWQETRIPLFEQAVAVGGIQDAAFGPVKRVTFGSGYVRQSLFELFVENRDHYPMMLPVDLGGPDECLDHLRLQNGTIWRWNRPLIGFDEDGTPHLRIEHRVMPAGPSVVDTIANAALFWGLTVSLAEQQAPVASGIEFARVRDNFYTAAKHGLGAALAWTDGRTWNLQELFRHQLLPMAREGLQGLGCETGEVDRYLGIVSERVRTGRTGARWQIECIERHGRDFALLVKRYLANQRSGLPVHEWPAP